jgi:hypothetical protein
MGKDTGFLEFDKESPPLRPVDERVRDFKEFNTFLSKRNTTIHATGGLTLQIPF